MSVKIVYALSFNKFGNKRTGWLGGLFAMTIYHPASKTDSNYTLHQNN